MKRAAFIAGIAFEIVFVAGAVVLEHFSRAKLGFIRWLNYHNQKWEAGLPVPALETLAVVLLAALLCAALVLFARNRRKGAPAIVSLVVLLAFVAALSYCAFGVGTSQMRACYLIELCLFMAGLLQAFQALALCRGAATPGKRGRHERS